jgi:phosphoribosyl-AMP cyclohydrolase
MEKIELKFDEQGLLTAIVQDADTLEVLMVAMMDQRAFDLTCQTKKAHFWSRSRQSLWLKGEISGNLMHVAEMRIDCDGDAVLLLVHSDGPACHTNNRSCFYRSLENNDAV